MTTYYVIGATIELPDGIGARASAIALAQPAHGAFMAELTNVGFTPVAHEKILNPKGPREPKAVTPVIPIAPGAVELAADAPVGVGGAAHETPTERPHRTSRAAE